MSDNIETWLRAQVDDDETLAESDYDIMISARKVRDAAAEIARLRARVAELEAVIDPGVLQAAKRFPVEEAIRKAVEGSLLTDQQKIEVYLAYKYRWIKAFFAGGRRKGMEEAAKIADGRQSDRGEEIAVAIRVAAEEGEP